MIDRTRALVARRGWPVASFPPGLLLYLLATEVAVGAWAAVEMVTSQVRGRDVFVGLLLLVLAIGFEEGSNRVSRLQWRLGPDLKRDMTSVWTVAATVAVVPAIRIPVLCAIATHVWFRQRRPANQPLYRNLYNGTVMVGGSLAAGILVRHLAPSWAHLPFAVSGALTVLVALAAFTVVNRLLITVALVWVGVRGKALLGASDDNLTELATLCLGGLVALAALHEPWLCILVLAPMVSLQRGSFVRELESAATVDSKTGLLNAVAWEHVANRELARSAREKSTLAVLIIDLDRFKLVNDVFGHLAGDSVLRGIGRCVEAAVREYDTVGRFGGEEFVAVLPDTSEADAMVVAERVRSRVAELTVGQFVDRVTSHDPLSISVGVACTPTDGLELSDLLHAADGGLYAAKAAGRNRVRLALRGEGSTRQPEHA